MKQIEKELEQLQNSQRQKIKVIDNKIEKIEEKPKQIMKQKQIIKPNTKTTKKVINDEPNAYYIYRASEKDLNNIPYGIESLFIENLEIGEDKKNIISNLPASVRRIFINYKHISSNLNKNLEIEDMDKYFKLPHGCSIHSLERGRGKYSGDNTKRLKILGKYYIPVKLLRVVVHDYEDDKDYEEDIKPSLKISKTDTGYSYITFNEPKTPSYFKRLDYM